MKGKGVHSFLGPTFGRQQSCASVAPIYPTSAPSRVLPAYPNHTIHPSPIAYNWWDQYQKGQLSKRERVSTLLSEPLKELLVELLNANLVTRMQLQPVLNALL